MLVFSSTLQQNSSRRNVSWVTTTRMHEQQDEESPSKKLKLSFPAKSILSHAQHVLH
jgi:hypothetical protein